MNSQNSTECPQTSPEPTAVDLTAVEDRYRAGQGVDFTEVKEAMVDGLLRLTEQHCTGEGSDAEIIYGARPSSRLVSAFLLPRYDRSGNEDETSDIHIATMGVDLQVAAGTAGTVTIEPALSVFVRELPSWSEIADPRNDMMPQIQLSREARQAVEQRARQYIDEGIAALPPVEDQPQEDEFERAGNALAQAERAHELAEVPDDSPETPATADELRTAQGNARAAESSERAAIQHQDRSRRRATVRNERNATVAMIRCEAFDRAFLELGIYVVDANGQAQRPLSAGDIEEAPHSELIETGIEDAQDSAAATQPEATTAGDEEEGPPPAAGAVSALREGTGRIADEFAAPQPIPQKWRRWRLDLGTFSFDAGDEAAREHAIASFADTLRARLSEALAAWLATNEGQRDAYRPGERALPSHFADEVSWNGYLAALRARRPAVINDVRPDISGVKLIVDLDPDFSDATRLNLRVAIQNDSSMPAGRDPSAFEHAIFQVDVQVGLPRALHKPLRLDRVKPSYRFRDWLEYPAMGLNCGVRQLASDANQMVVRTTWAPRYCQPRIEPRSIEGVPTSYVELSSETSDPALLFALPDEYETWIESQSGLDAGANLDADLAEQERRSHAEDIEAYRRFAETQSVQMADGLMELVFKGGVRAWLHAVARQMKIIPVGKIGAPQQVSLPSVECATAPRKVQGAAVERRLAPDEVACFALLRGVKKRHHCQGMQKSHIARPRWPLQNAGAYPARQRFQKPLKKRESRAVQRRGFAKTSFKRDQVDKPRSGHNRADIECARLFVGAILRLSLFLENRFSLCLPRFQTFKQFLAAFVGFGPGLLQRF